MVVITIVGRGMLYCCDCVTDSDSDELGQELDDQETSTFRSPTKTPTLELPYVYSQLNVIVEDEEEEEEDGKASRCIDSEFDPDQEYVKNFDQLGWHATTLMPLEISTSVVDDMVISSEQALSSTELTPREITQNLQRLNSAIRMTSDAEKKAQYIKRYELRKFDHDEDNIDDKEKSFYAIADARNPNFKPLDRIHQYQMAIKFTNNVVLKEELRAEYRRYCFTVKYSGKK